MLEKDLNSEATLYIAIQDKISVGLTLTMGNIIKTCSIPFAFFSLMIATYIFTTYKEKLYRIIASIPLLSVLLLGTFLPILNAFACHSPTA